MNRELAVANVREMSMHYTSSMAMALSGHPEIANQMLELAELAMIRVLTQLGVRGQNVLERIDAS